MPSLVFYLWASVAMALATPRQDFWVSPMAPECHQVDSTLTCDYSDKPQLTVYCGELVDSSVQKITIHNCQKLRLSESMCKHIGVFNVPHVEVISSKDDEEICGKTTCDEGIILSLRNSTIDMLPCRIRQLHIEESSVGLLSASHTLNSLYLRNSTIKVFDVSSPAVKGSSFMIHNSTVDVIRSLAVGPQSKILMEDSELGVIESRAIILNGGKLVFKNTVARSGEGDDILLLPETSVVLEEFKGNLTFMVLGNDRMLTQPLRAGNSSLEGHSHSENCLPDEQYYSAYIAFLVLFVVMTILFVIQIVLSKRKKIQHRTASMDVLSNNRDTPSTNTKEPTSQALLYQESTNKVKNLSNSIDAIEDDLVKSVEITKALHLEDLEDLKSDMTSAMEVHKKAEFEKFVKENSKRLELQEFHIKSNSKVDKNMALMEKMNHAVRQLIQEQYLNCSFELQNSGSSIELKHQECMAQCNKRFFYDLVDIIKSAIAKWDDELQAELCSPAPLNNYLRIVLSKLLSTTNQLEEKLERLVLESKDEHQTRMKTHGKEYQRKLELINAVAEERSELVKNAEKEDTQVFGSKKASRLSLLHEETTVTSQIRQKKEAEFEYSETKQSLLLQEKIQQLQEENITQLERIIMTLTELRNSYVQSTKAPMSQSSSISIEGLDHWTGKNCRSQPNNCEE